MTGSLKRWNASIQSLPRALAWDTSDTPVFGAPVSGSLSRITDGTDSCRQTMAGKCQ